MYLVCKTFISKHSTSSEIIYLIEAGKRRINSDIFYRIGILLSQVPQNSHQVNREQRRESRLHLQTRDVCTPTNKSLFIKLQ